MLVVLSGQDIHGKSINGRIGYISDTNLRAAHYWVMIGFENVGNNTWRYVGDFNDEGEPFENVLTQSNIRMHGDRQKHFQQKMHDLNLMYGSPVFDNLNIGNPFMVYF
tara:strand:- start:7352 stop:7675 length:324 start_codon:yes stop_codon:yes gene_type:complete